MRRREAKPPYPPSCIAAAPGARSTPGGTMPGRRLYSSCFQGARLLGARSKPQSGSTKTSRGLAGVPKTRR